MPIPLSALEHEPFLRMLLMGFPKEGKALANGEPVLTPYGWLPIEALHVGDAVIGSTGKPVEVTGVFPQGRKEVARVVADDGAQVLCSLDHLWTTATKLELKQGRYFSPRVSKDRNALRPHIPTGKVGSGSVKTTLQIRETTQLTHYLPRIQSPVCFAAAQEEQPLDPYFLGLMLGDGSLLRKLQFCKPDQELLSYVVRYATALGDDAKIYHTGERCPIVNITGAESGAVRSKLTALGLYNLRSPEKFIPRLYMTGRPIDRLKMLRGLCDTDGHCGEKGTQAEFSTASTQLASDIVDIVRSLGGRAYRREKIVESTIYWSVRISFDDGTCPFALGRKAAGWKTERKQFRQRIDLVEPQQPTDCTCITVDAIDCLFVTRDFLLTHNSTHAISTAPPPTRVLICESDTALRGAKDEAKRLGTIDQIGIERILPSSNGKIFDRLLTAIIDAKKDAKEGRVKSVVVDPLSLLADHILNESFEDTKTKDGSDDGRRGHPLLTKRMLHAVELMLTIPANLIVVSHYMEVGGDDNGDRPKSGVGIVPLMPNMALRTKIASLFYDILWFERANKDDTNHYENRVFVTGKEGAWGLGCRSRKGNFTLPAHVGKFLEWINEVPRTAPKGKLQPLAAAARR